MVLLFWFYSCKTMEKCLVFSFCYSLALPGYSSSWKLVKHSCSAEVPSKYPSLLKTRLAVRTMLKFPRPEPSELILLRFLSNIHSNLHACLGTTDLLCSHHSHHQESDQPLPFLNVQSAPKPCRDSLCIQPLKLIPAKSEA